jgi:hypothetical protein
VIAGNKIERGIRNTDDRVFGYASVSEAKGKLHRRLRFNDLNELRRMHRDHHGSPDPIDDHLLERVLCNVCSVLEPLGNTLRDLDARDGLVIFGNTV